MSLTSTVLRVHGSIYKRTEGRLGHHMLGVPALLLRTIGRRSRATRTNALIYARDGEDYLVVASNGGADQNPGWLYNIEAHPEVEIQLGRQRVKTTGRVIDPSDADYARLWGIVNTNNHDRYTAYQKQTSRPIPIVALTASPV